jgi:hypothetical protein
MLQRTGNCQAVRVFETSVFSESQFAFKVRALLVTGDVLQVRVYRNGDHTDYSYQVVRNDTPILRWDNKEHFPGVDSYPHHFHSMAGQVQSSPMTGDPMRDLPLVMSLLFSTD